MDSQQLRLLQPHPPFKFLNTLGQMTELFLNNFPIQFLSGDLACPSFT